MSDSLSVEESVGRIKSVLQVVGYDVKSSKSSYTLYALKKNKKGEIVNKTIGYYPTLESLLAGMVEHKVMTEDVIHNVEVLVDMKKEIIKIIKDSM